MGARRASVPDGLEHEILIPIPAGNEWIGGSLTVARGHRGLVLFAHGSGSSRFSPRNRRVASGLNGAGLATFLVDLLTPAEEAADARTALLRFDIRLLADRLLLATDRCGLDRATGDLRVGYFGSSTGAAAALVAAAERPETVRAVVSRGGRPDLALGALARVAAPTLLIVGGRDETVLRLNREALSLVGCAAKRLAIVPGATHLFEEEGALDAVARLARNFFAEHLLGLNSTQKDLK